MRKQTFCIIMRKQRRSSAVTAKLIRAFVFAARISQFLYFLNPKFTTSSQLLCLYSSVCIPPGRKLQCLFSRVVLPSGGHIPRDSTYVTTEEVSIPLPLYITLTVLAGLGIVSAIVFFAFNIIFRNNKYVFFFCLGSTCFCYRDAHYGNRSIFKQQKQQQF